MKKIFVLIVACILGNILSAQTLDDIGRMSIMVQKPSNKNIPKEALCILDDRMHQILTTNGIADNDFNKRFVLSSTVSVLKKDVISGSPSRVSQTLEIVFYIKDVKENKEYGSVSITSVGVGQNENKAFIMAFNNVKPGNEKILKMINTSKELIIAYYRTNIDKIIQDAYILAEQGTYDRALYILAQVPDVCTDCTEKCQVATLDLFQRKIDSEGCELLQKAKAEWTASPNASGAVKASQYLSKIHILAACQPDVDVLMEEMKTKVKDDERIAWEFQMQKYADDKAREQRDFEFAVQQYQDNQKREAQRHQEDLAREHRDHEFAVKQFEANHARDMAMIDASREIVVEYIKNNPNAY